MAEESGERTEEATEKRMKEVREKGKLQRSQDVAAWVAVGTAVAFLPGVFSKGYAAAEQQQRLIADVAANPTVNSTGVAVEAAFGSILPTLGVFMAAICVAIIVASTAQGGLHVKKFKPKFEQFDVVKGLQRLVGIQALWTGAKALLKTAAIAAVMYVLVSGLTERLIGTPLLPLDALAAEASAALTAVLTWAVAAGVVLAALDVLVISKKNKKQTRMTKKEVKDEHKNTDGDPLIKQRRRSIQMQGGRNRMIAATADADVVIVNPTHIALALKYEDGIGVPQVVAKGSDDVASRIRELAAENRIPVVESIDLAWELWDVCEPGDFVPHDSFKPVAQVFAFIRNLKEAAYRDGRILQLPRR